MRIPFSLLRIPDLMQRWNDPNCIRIVLEQNSVDYNRTPSAPRSECHLSIFFTSIFRVLHGTTPGIFKTVYPGSTPSFLGPDLCFGKTSNIA